MAMPRKSAKKSPSRPSAANSAAQRKAVRPETAVDGKMLPPRDTVDVPRQPAKPAAGTPDEAGKDSRPARDNQDESNWTDGSKPRPHAKNARSHLL